MSRGRFEVLRPQTGTRMKPALPGPGPALRNLPSPSSSDEMCFSSASLLCQTPCYPHLLAGLLLALRNYGNGPSSPQAESSGLPGALRQPRVGECNCLLLGPCSLSPAGLRLGFIFPAPVPEVVVLHSRHLMHVSCLERIPSSCSSSKPCQWPQSHIISLCPRGCWEDQCDRI